MHIKTKTNKKFHEFYKKNFQKLNFVGGKCVKIRSSINLTWGHPRSHTKVGPDRFSRFDVYLYKQTTPRQTSKVYIEMLELMILLDVLLPPLYSLNLNSLYCLEALA